MKHHYKPALFVVTVLFNAPVFAHSPAAHVHGVVTLQIAQEGNEVSVAISSPLANVLGFEHAPRTAQQKQDVQDMQALLQKPATLLTLTPAAQCTIKSLNVTSDALKIGVPAPTPTSAPVSTSAKLKPVSPDAKDEQDKHAHFDIDIDIVYTCRAAATLKGATVEMFNAFPHIRRIDAQVVSPRGQSATTLTSKQRQLSW